jgi:hypothetical protein
MDKLKLFIFLNIFAINANSTNFVKNREIILINEKNLEENNYSNNK